MNKKSVISEKNRYGIRSIFNKKFVLTMLIISILCVCKSTVNASSYKAEQREKIRVGFFAMDGYHMMDANGNRSGYGYDFLQLVSRYLDMDFEYVGYDKSWGEMQTMLENGEIDLLTSARKTAQREKKFDFSRPIGSSSAILTIRSDNSKIIMHDFDTYNGMKIALLKGNSRNDDLAAFARENKFTYHPVYFDATDDMTTALQEGTVDAIVTSSLRQTKNERIIEKFNSADFYAIVKKGNTKLLNQINYAIDQMNSSEGDWRTDLHNQYYENYNNRNLNFTKEEKQIIKEYSSKATPLTVICDPTRYPYSYVKNGKVVGILPDYFRRLAKYAGISYKFVACTSREEYLKQRSDGSADLCLDLRMNAQSESEIPNCSVTASYLTLRMAMVTRTDFNGKIKVVSTVDHSAAFDDSYAKGAKKIVYKTRDKAMQAVLDGKADAAFVYYYTAQAFVNREKSGTLTYTLLEETSYNYHIAVLPQVNHALAGILTKAIYAMPNSLIEDISSKYTSYQARDITFLMLMQMHPIISVCIGILLALIVVTLLIGRIHNQKRLTKIASQKAEEMKVLAEKADAANKAKSLFLANMSHDIRTPINGILGLLKINETHFDDVDLIRTNQEKMMVSANHLLSLVNDVLQMSKMEDGEVVLERELIDLRELAPAIVTIVIDHAKESEITWNFDKDKSVIPHYYVYGSPLHLRQIFLNIYSNCIKYNHSGGSINTVIDVPEDKDGICTYRWTISDTGVGMSQEFLEHIFEPFVQEEKDARTTYHGTGLGMTIVKNLIEKMGGSIEISSEKGVGSTFIITIPFEVADISEPEDSQLQKEEKNPGISGLHLLLVEDNELNVEIAQMLLEDEGAEVVVVNNGEQAVKLFSETSAGTFDAILMDIMMPVMDGLTATKNIRALDRPDAKSIPIIAMTANAFVEDVEECLDVGMNAHLAKPIEMNKVISVLVKYCRLNK